MGDEGIDRMTITGPPSGEDGTYESTRGQLTMYERMFRMGAGGDPDDFREATVNTF